MAEVNTVGYLSAFDGTTLVDGSTKFAAAYVQNAAQVVLKTYRLPNGTVVNYDGTSDSALTVGPISQEVYAASSALTFYNTLVGKLGHYGTLTLTKLAGGTTTTSAILTAVRDVTPALTARSAMNIVVEFEVVTSWS